MRKKNVSLYQTQQQQQQNTFDEKGESRFGNIKRKPLFHYIFCIAVFDHRLFAFE